MNIDGLTIAALAAELGQILPGSRVQGIFHPQPSVVTLELWAGEEKRVLIETEQDARLHLTHQEFAHPERPSAFCMLLRKYLRNGFITSVAQLGLERILDLRVRDYILRAELLGKHANIILLQGDKILGALKPVVGARSFRAGETYQPPPSQQKLDPRSLTAEELWARLGPQETTVAQALLKTLDGIGPRLAQELALRAELDPAQSVASLRPEQLTLLWRVSRELFTEQFRPCLYFQDEKPFDAAPIPLQTYAHLRCESRPTLSEALDECAGVATQENRFAHEHRRLQEFITRHSIEVGRALARVKQDLEKAQHYEQLKHEGDLLMANLHKLHKGLGEIELEDFLDGTRKTIKLDPALEPIENAQKKFERYKKLKRAKEKLAARLEELEQELRHFQEFASHLQQAHNEDDLAQIREALGSPRERREPHGERASGPREFVIKGYRVWVGRSSKQNDALVRQAAREDYWLHARDRPGSHVIVKNPHSREIPPEVLQQAAQLAAYYSKGRDAKKVPVSYTRVKYLRKGGRPGLVMMTHEEGTLIVTPKGEP